MLLLYNFLSFMALVLYSPFIFFKKGPSDRTVFVKERLGLSLYEKTDIWVHAVSVGEIIACIPFLKAMKKEFPSHRITLSTTTYTGQKVARERFPEADRIMYMPWDTGICAGRVVDTLRPRLFITIETEIWPVLFRALKEHGSKVVMLNGRISNNSYKGYKRLDFVMREVLSFVDFLYMQSTSDAERIISIGAEERKVAVMGNFKFDISMDSSAPLLWLENIDGKIFLAASTHRGEEEIILDAFARIQKEFPDTKLIIAPRHPERFQEVEGLLKQRGLNFIRRSGIHVREKQAKKKDMSQPSLFDTAEPEASTADVILLDTIGELSRVFSKVTVAFIGGSLVPLGGHNILEPAFWGKPILFGPHMENFAFAADFLHQYAAIQVKDARDISVSVCNLLGNEHQAAGMGQKAKQMVDKSTGAVKKAMELVRGILGTA